MKLKKILYNLVGALIIAFIISAVGKPLETKLIAVLSRTFELIAKKSLLNELLFTSKHFLIGFFIAVFTAIPLGILIGRIKFLSNIFDIPIEMLRPIPSAVIIPFGLALLGVGLKMKVFVIWYGAFWPLLISTQYSARNIDPILIQVSHIFHLSKFRTFISIIFPASLPSIISGLKVSVAIALLLAVTVEMIAGGNPRGLGYFIIDSERSFNQEDMLVGTILLALFGYLINYIFSIIEKLLYEKRFKYLKLHKEI